MTESNKNAEVSEIDKKQPTSTLKTTQEIPETPTYAQPNSSSSKGFLEFIKSVLSMEYNPKSRHRQHERIGQTLVNMGAIRESELAEAIAEQKRTGQLLGRILLARGCVDAESVSIALSKLSGLEYTSLEKTPSDPNALDAISESVAIKYKLLPVSIENNRLIVLIEAPQDRDGIEDVSVLLGMRIHPVLTTTDDIRHEIRTRYHATKVKKRRPQSVIMTPEDREKLAKTMESLSVSAKPAEQDESAANTKDTAEKVDVKKEGKRDTPISVSQLKQRGQNLSGMPVVKLVSTIIEDALNAGATDIHLDPQDPEMRIRYRVDGVLHDIMTIPANLESAVVSRVKIMAEIDITETRHPQDGHITLILGDRECDIRVATLPTFLGERVVMRLLDQSAVLGGISGLGLTKKEEISLKKIIDEPYGMILVTGPTGSGKTTTLYTALNQKNIKTESIVTLEDPVEYQLEGINQVQIDTEIDLTFASTLRASLRQDIDVLLIGEIRDAETARIAVRAAMTGHLVFSTLHTNDAPEAISTLRNMGIPSYLLGSALTGIVGQRLVKTICPECKARIRPGKALLRSLNLPETTKSLYRGKGCDACYSTGSHGRTGIFEILAVTPQIRRLITDEAKTEQIIEEAQLQTLADNCRDKVKSGVVAPEEFLRVIRY